MMMMMMMMMDDDDDVEDDEKVFAEVLTTSGYRKLSKTKTKILESVLYIASYARRKTF